MGTGTGILIGLIMGLVLAYIFLNGNQSNFTLPQISSSQESSLQTNQTQITFRNSCINQVNNQINILKNKITSSSSVSIVNYTIFGTLSSNQSANNVEAWAQEWVFGYSLATRQDGCFGGYGATYFCSDVNLAYNQSMYAEGVAVKVQYSGFGTSSSVYPVLCGNGNLLIHSLNWLKNWPE